MGQWSFWMIKKLEETLLEIGNKAIWGRGMWIDISIWMKGAKIFVFHVNTHKKVTSAIDCNNQVDKMTCSVNSGQPPSIANPVIAQRESMNSVALVAEMEIMHGFSNMHSQPPTLILLQSLLNIQCASSRNQH